METDLYLASIDELLIRAKEGTGIGSLLFDRVGVSGVIAVKYTYTYVEAGNLSNRTVESSYLLPPAELLEMMRLLESKYSGRDRSIVDNYHDSQGRTVRVVYEHLKSRVIIYFPNEERLEVGKDLFLDCLYLIGPIDPEHEKSLVKLAKQIRNPKDEERLREAARFITLSPDQIACLETLLDQVKENLPK